MSPRAKKKSLVIDHANPDPARYFLGSAATRNYRRNVKLWRYLTLEKFAWLLETSQLWHTRLDFLGDPFEGSFPKAYVQMRDAGQLPRYLQTGLGPESEKQSNKAILYSYYATCWYQSRHESAGMWNLYATKHAGVAIVTTPLRMYEAVDLSPYYGAGILSPVEYHDFEKSDMLLRPISKSHGRKASPPLLKRAEFRHENEVRGLIHFCNPFSSDPKDYPMSGEINLRDFAEKLRKNGPAGISVKADLKLLIKEIYLSPLAKPYFKDVVRAMADRHGLGDLIKESALSAEPLH